MNALLPITVCRRLTLPKQGNRPEECEDASASNDERHRFAIADGASESVFAREWAERLVESFVQSNAEQTPADWLPRAQQAWVELVTQRPIPWYAETKVEEGAFATFLGVALVATRRWCRDLTLWRAFAVGDGCLFHVSRDRLLTCFPMHSAQDFGNAPWLLGSRSRELPGQEASAQAWGICRPGDRLWLMTDALALWFLQRREACERPWQQLNDVLAAPDPEQQFTGWIEQLRRDQVLRNDDVTLMAIGF